MSLVEREGITRTPERISNEDLDMPLGMHLTSSGARFFDQLTVEKQQQVDGLFKIMMVLSYPPTDINSEQVFNEELYVYVNPEEMRNIRQRVAKGGLGAYKQELQNKLDELLTKGGYKEKEPFSYEEGEFEEKFWKNLDESERQDIQRLLKGAPVESEEDVTSAEDARDYNDEGIPNKIKSKIRAKGFDPRYFTLEQLKKLAGF